MPGWKRTPGAVTVDALCDAYGKQPSEWRTLRRSLERDVSGFMARVGLELPG